VGLGGGEGLGLGEVGGHDEGDGGVDLEVVLHARHAPAVGRLFDTGVQHLIGELGVAAVAQAAFLQDVQEHHRGGAHLDVVLAELLDRRTVLVLWVASARQIKLINALAMVCALRAAAATASSGAASDTHAAGTATPATGPRTTVCRRPQARAQ